MSNVKLRQLAVGIGLLVASVGAARAQSQPAAQAPTGTTRDGAALPAMRRTTHADRLKAALHAHERRKAFEATRKGGARPNPAAKPGGPSASLDAGGGSTGGVRGAAAALLRIALAQVGTADLFASPNYATSKYPQAHCSQHPDVTCYKDADCPGYQPPFMIAASQYPGGETCTGAVVPGTGLKKFVDALPGLCPLGGVNGLGNCLPVAVPDTTTFPDGDYYELGLTEFTTQFHTNLPHKTKVRGYYQKNTTDPYASQPYYLGPLIVAKTGRPVRVKFANELPTGAAGNLFLPVDKTLPGTDLGPLGPAGGQYTQNRATIHLHGGNSPWISDGTQHQWTAPAGESTPYKKGLSVDYVPDMWFDASGHVVPACAAQTSCAVPGAKNDPGDGALTFYWTNQQSGRLMFFHDHSYGITRLNVYAGEAAGYLLVNPPDEDRLAAATVPGTVGTRFFDPAATAPATDPDLAHLVPLVIQDKTFVPPAAQLAAQDPTWDPARWGGEDQLWYPHVYMPNQWPGSPDNSNTNPMGRWDYGPWFWPPQTTLTTVTWDGQVQPRALELPCQTQAAVSATNPNGDTTCPSTPNPTAVPESFLDTPVVNGTAYPTLTVDPAAYRFQILNAANERNLNLSLFLADASGTEVTLVDAVPHSAASTPPLCTTSAAVSKVTGLPFGPDVPAAPVCWPREWPTDARQGGVPDPATAGPKWLQLGSEAGLLPGPAVIPPRPVSYEQNKRNIVVLNVANKALFLGPAERADVVVDFSAYAGKTLILYNDSPAPVPAGDPRQDTYTGDPDFTTTGGAPTTLPGYGPNNRTIMQIVVRAAAQGGTQQPLDEAAITSALRQSFVASQPKPIVPEAAYNALYQPATPYANTYLSIQALSLQFTPVGETSAITLNFGNKALHELFTTDYGRMDSLLGVEIPNSNWLNQTTIPFANYDPATEFLTDQQPQIWKITHNGVDTHTIHFHLFNAQVVNRVGWDGQIRPPDDNELGWKESVRMNPLEDVIIALKPVKQNLPWPLPDKVRPLDVDRPLGTASQFTGVDVHNNPFAPPIQNQLMNFGQEYVWHCHLLGHEEMDMLRAEILVVAPETPSGLTATSSLGTALLQWSDNSKSAMSFAVERDVTPDFLAPTPFAVNQSGPQPGTVQMTDNTIAPGQTYFYRVRANKVLTSPALPGETFPAPSSWSNVAQLGTPPLVAVSPAALTFGPQLLYTPSAPQSLTVTTAGSGVIALSSSIAGPNAAEFAQTSTCGTSQTAPASCQLSVSFTPAATGARSATLTVTTSDPAQAPIVVALTGTGAAPVATVTPTSLAFGSQLVNVASTSQQVTLTNAGTLDLAVGAIAVAGPDAASFVASPGCPATLAASASCTVGVVFKPTATGARAARLTLATSDPVNPTLTVPLTGTGVAPLATVAPASLGFGNQLVTAPATPGAAQTVTVTNSGTAQVQALAIALGGASAAEFAQTSTCGTAIAAGTSCTVSVTLAPATTGAKAATLSITGTDGVNPIPALSVALSGTGVAPRATLAPAALTFATQLLANPSAAQTVQLSNAGSAPLTVTGISISGDFTQTNACPATLAAGASCAIGVTFTPTAAGARTGTLTVVSSDPVNPTVGAALSGTGSAVDLAPAVLSFGNQLVATTSATRNATLNNAGTTALTLTSVSVSGANAADYTVLNNCGTTLGAGRSCTLGVRFTPSAVGASSATLTVVTSDPASPSSITLSGTGTAPVAVVSPTSLAFTSALNVASAAQAVTVSNTGTAPLAIGGITLGGASPSQFAQANGCGTSVAPGASCTIDVTFTPTTYGGVLTKTATLTVSVGAPASSQTVTLSGTIVVPTYTVTPAALAFGKQPVGTTSAAQSVVVANTGTVALGVRGITLGGTNPSSFAQTSSCGTSLAAGASCTVSVTFRPTSIGAKSATLNVRVSAPAVSQSVTLTGSGQ